MAIVRLRGVDAVSATLAADTTTSHATLYTFLKATATAADRSLAMREFTAALAASHGANGDRTLISRPNYRLLAMCEEVVVDQVMGGIQRQFGGTSLRSRPVALAAESDTWRHFLLHALPADRGTSRDAAGAPSNQGGTATATASSRQHEHDIRLARTAQAFLQQQALNDNPSSFSRASAPQQQEIVTVADGNKEHQGGVAMHTDTDGTDNTTTTAHRIAAYHRRANAARSDARSDDAAGRSASFDEPPMVTTAAATLVEVAASAELPSHTQRIVAAAGQAPSTHVKVPPLTHNNGNRLGGGIVHREASLHGESHDEETTAEAGSHRAVAPGAAATALQTTTTKPLSSTPLLEALLRTVLSTRQQHADVEHPDDVEEKRQVEALTSTGKALQLRIAALLQQQQQQDSGNNSLLKQRQLLEHLRVRVQNATTLLTVNQHEQRTLEMTSAALQVEVAAMTQMLRLVLAAMMRTEAAVLEPHHNETIESLTLLATVRQLLDDASEPQAPSADHSR